MTHYFLKYKLSHLFFFAAVFLLIKLSFVNDPSVSQWKQWLTSFYYVLIITLTYFIAIDKIVPLFLNKQNEKGCLLFLSLVFVTGTILVVLKYYTLRDGTAAFEHSYWSIFNLLAGCYLAVFLLSAAGAGFVFFREENSIKLNLEMALKEKTKAELDFLKAQLNPHFIFNSINAVYVQIDMDPVKAKETLHTFSELLRYQLYECKADKVQVSKELEYLNHYIELQKVRKDHRYQIEFSYSYGVNDLFIAPLLLMPFVENAFKYVSGYRHKLNTIALQVKLKEHMFSFNIRNSTEPGSHQNLASPTSSGIGLANVKRRLELIYPGRHELTITREKDFFEVNLTIKL